ncbi:hypothetical protein KC973_02550 [Candidatus Saccharibacteria bacterium]|nr:hypothetical protein [Candidatus Saccharibacteria bacterium]
MNKPLLIAEVKTRSPFGYVSQRSWDELFKTANKHGDIISIHTDPRWGGSLELVAKARALSTKPILAKGIHATDDEIQSALDIGADYVLVVGRLPDTKLLSRCLIEPSTLEQLEAFITELPPEQKIVWNSRNLADGSNRDRNEFSTARSLWPCWLCQASNIRSSNDVVDGADAILVGEHLEEFIAGVSA